MNSKKIIGLTTFVAVIALAFFACEPEPAHVHDYQWSVTTAATCIAKGLETGVCTQDATHTTTRDIPIDLTDGHDWGDWTGTATCETAGTGTRVCKRSDTHTETDNNLPALGHNYLNYTVTTAATCSAEGEEEAPCSRDAAHAKGKREIAIDPVAHDWQTSSGTAPTCTTDGNGVQICSYNEAHTISGVLPKLGHDYQNYTETTPATCTTEGVETGTCTHDQSTTTRPIVIDPAAHDWKDNWIQTSAPNCTTAEVETDTCNHNETHTRNRAGAAIIPDAHDWNTTHTVISTVTATTDGVEAITCKHNSSHTKDQRTAYATGTAGILFTLINNDTAYRVSTGPYTSVIHIPAYHRPDANSPYLPVTEIGNEAFYTNYSLTSVTIPDSVTSIGNSAFQYCTSLTNITIPDSVTSIGNSAFSRCDSLTSIIIPDSVTSIGTSTFVNCDKLTSISIGAGVTSIDSYINSSGTYNLFAPFAGCPNLRNIIIANDKVTVTSSSNWLNKFSANNLSVTFKKNVGNYAFYSSSANTRLTSVTFAEGVTSIGTYAFQNCIGLTSVTIAEGVTSIGSYAFQNCSSVPSITIPASVTAIASYAFYSWTNAQTIYVEGYSSQSTADSAWGTAWRTGCNAVIIYVPEAVALDATITNTAEWNNALTQINGKRGTATLTISGSFSVAGSTNSSFGTTANGYSLTVTLKGSGTVSLSSNGNMLRVGANQTLIIDSEDLILQGRSSNAASLVGVIGALELRNGTIRGNTNTADSWNTGNGNAYGGGVYVGGSGASFIMSGGTISGNTAYGVGNVQSGNNKAGQGYGGGVYVSDGGSFTMMGGTISGNQARSAYGPNDYSNDVYGGGVCVRYGATFRIVNGTIYGSNASPSTLSNTLNPSSGGTAYGAALYNGGTAQRGTFSGGTWTSSGDLTTTNNTVNVVNGVSQ